MKKEKLAVLIMMSLMACGVVSYDEPVQKSGLALTATSDSAGDVSYLHFKISKCGGDLVAESLSPLAAQGDYPVVDLPLSDVSEGHRFAHFFTLLDSGCYDMEAIPLREDETPSQLCSSANLDNVMVHESTTSEILLAVLCEAPEKGSIDIKAFFNFQPIITHLSYDPSRFITCGELLQVCVSASDRDSDLMEMVWVPAVGASLSVSYSNQIFSLLTECVEILIHDEGTHLFEVTVYDLFESVRVETWLQTNVDPNASSNATTTFEVVALCEPIIECVRDSNFYLTNNQYSLIPSNQTPWPLSEDTILCGETWLDTLNTTYGGVNVWGKLANQTIAAFLNVENMTEPSDYAIDAVTLAHDILTNSCTMINPSSVYFAQANHLIEVLTDFNTDHAGICD